MNHPHPHIMRASAPFRQSRDQKKRTPYLRCQDASNGKYKRPWLTGTARCSTKQSFAGGERVRIGGDAELREDANRLKAKEHGLQDTSVFLRPWFGNF